MTPLRFRLLVFDWDGTLMDSAARIVSSIQRAATDVRLPVPKVTDVQEVIGLDLGGAIGRLFPRTSSILQERMVARYRHYYLTADATPTPLFDGVAETLEALATDGYTMAVATGKGRRGLDQALRESGLAHVFAASRCPDEAPSKPNPQMLLELMDELRATWQETLMVGDTEYDMAMARNAGARGLAVTYGVHAGDRLLREGAIDLLPSIHALPPWLRRAARADVGPS